MNMKVILRGVRSPAESVVNIYLVYNTRMITKRQIIYIQVTRIIENL